MTGWSFLVNVCLPPPLILLVILTVPLPQAIRRGVLAATKKLILFPIVGGLEAVHVVMSVTAYAFVEQSYKTAALRAQPLPALMSEVGIHRGKIWRAERNFWLSLFCFFIWWMLAAYYRTLVKLFDVSDENKRLKQQLNVKGDPKQGEKKRE